jgi:hypothetical protein
MSSQISRGRLTNIRHKMTENGVGSDEVTSNSSKPPVIVSRVFCPKHSGISEDIMNLNDACVFPKKYFINYSYALME